MAINPQAVRDAREAAGLTQEGLADRIGASQTTIDKIERGLTESSRFLPQIAQVLQTPLHKLDPVFAFTEQMRATSAIIGQATEALYRKLPPEKQREINRLEAHKEMRGGANGDDVPVYPAVEGGAGALIIDKEPIEYVRRPEPLIGVKDGYLAYIAGDSMYPAFRPGEKAIVHPRLPVIPDEVYIFYTNDQADDRAMIKFLQKATATDWLVEQYNPARDFAISRAEWPVCHRVVGKYSRS